MKYVLLLYGNEAAYASKSPEAIQAEMAEYSAFDTLTAQRGVTSVLGEALHPVTTAKTVRIRDGKTLTIDGPFAETKEQLGGIYVLNCKDLDEAIEMATYIPAVREGSVEIRPLVVFD